MKTPAGRKRLCEELVQLVSEMLFEPFGRRVLDVPAAFRVARRC